MRLTRAERIAMIAALKYAISELEGANGWLSHVAKWKALLEHAEAFDADDVDE
jgi:hypothetical protein